MLSLSKAIPVDCVGVILTYNSSKAVFLNVYQSCKSVKHYLENEFPYANEHVLFKVSGSVNLKKIPYVLKLEIVGNVEVKFSVFPNLVELKISSSWSDESKIVWKDEDFDGLCENCDKFQKVVFSGRGDAFQLTEEGVAEFGRAHEVDFSPLIWQNSSKYQGLANIGLSELTKMRKLTLGGVIIMGSEDDHEEMEFTGFVPCLENTLDDYKGFMWARKDMDENGSLEDLTLRYLRIDCHQCEKTLMENLSDLKSLQIWIYTDITDDGIAKLHKLERLILPIKDSFGNGGCRETISDDAFENCSSTLVELSCPQSDEITNEGLGSLKNLQILRRPFQTAATEDVFGELFNLREVVIDNGEKLSDVGLIFLQNVEVLEVKNAVKLTDDSLGYLKKTRKLVLDHAKSITDYGAGILGSLKSLKDVKITFAKISDGGVSQFLHIPNVLVESEYLSITSVFEFQKREIRGDAYIIIADEGEGGYPDDEVDDEFLKRNTAVDRLISMMRQMSALQNGYGNGGEAPSDV